MGVLPYMMAKTQSIGCNCVKGIKPVKLVVGVTLIKVSEWRER